MIKIATKHFIYIGILIILIILLIRLYNNNSIEGFFVELGIIKIDDMDVNDVYWDNSLKNIIKENQPPLYIYYNQNNNADNDNAFGYRGNVGFMLLDKIVPRTRLKTLLYNDNESSFTRDVDNNTISYNEINKFEEIGSIGSSEDLNINNFLNDYDYNIGLNNINQENNLNKRKILTRINEQMLDTEEKTLSNLNLFYENLVTEQTLNIRNPGINNDRKLLEQILEGTFTNADVSNAQSGLSNNVKKFTKYLIRNILHEVNDRIKYKSNRNYDNKQTAITYIKKLDNVINFLPNEISELLNLDKTREIIRNNLGNRLGAIRIQLKLKNPPRESQNNPDNRNKVRKFAEAVYDRSNWEQRFELCIYPVNNQYTKIFKEVNPLYNSYPNNNDEFIASRYIFDHMDGNIRRNAIVNGIIDKILSPLDDNPNTFEIATQIKYHDGVFIKRQNHDGTWLTPTTLIEDYLGTKGFYVRFLNKQYNTVIDNGNTYNQFATRIGRGREFKRNFNHRFHSEPNLQFKIKKISDRMSRSLGGHVSNDIPSDHEFRLHFVQVISKKSVNTQTEIDHYMELHYPNHPFLQEYRDTIQQIRNETRQTNDLIIGQYRRFYNNNSIKPNGHTVTMNLNGSGQTNRKKISIVGGDIIGSKIELPIGINIKIYPSNDNDVKLNLDIPYIDNIDLTNTNNQVEQFIKNKISQELTDLISNNDCELKYKNNRWVFTINNYSYGSYGNTIEKINYTLLPDTYNKLNRDMFSTKYKGIQVIKQYLIRTKKNLETIKAHYQTLYNQFLEGTIKTPKIKFLKVKKDFIPETHVEVGHLAIKESDISQQESANNYLVNNINYKTIPKHCYQKVRNWDPTDKVYEINSNGNNLKFYKNPFTKTIIVTNNNKMPDGFVGKIIPCPDKNLRILKLKKANIESRKKCKQIAKIKNDNKLSNNLSDDFKSNMLEDKIYNQSLQINDLKKYAHQLEEENIKGDIINQEYNRNRLQNYITEQKEDIVDALSKLKDGRKKYDININYGKDIINTIINIIANSDNIPIENRIETVKKLKELEKITNLGSDYKEKLAEILKDCPTFDMEGFFKRDPPCMGCRIPREQV